jgi:hypothetical protein
MRRSRRPRARPTLASSELRPERQGNGLDWFHRREAPRGTGRLDGQAEAGADRACPARRAHPDRRLHCNGQDLNGWAQAADRFAQTVGDELLRRVDGETDSAELIARVTAATNSHLRELSALPRAAADHFDTRLARVPTDN